MGIFGSQSVQIMPSKKAAVEVGPGLHCLHGEMGPARKLLSLKSQSSSRLVVFVLSVARACVCVCDRFEVSFVARAMRLSWRRA